MKHASGIDRPGATYEAIRAFCPVNPVDWFSYSPLSVQALQPERIKQMQYHPTCRRYDRYSAFYRAFTYGRMHTHRRA